ncbi:hypothetical protein D3C80_1819440 [compost metagenome]
MCSNNPPTIKKAQITSSPPPISWKSTLPVLSLMANTALSCADRISIPSPLSALRFIPRRANTPAATMAKILPSTAAGASCATYTSGVDPRIAE